MVISYLICRVQNVFWIDLCLLCAAFTIVSMTTLYTIVCLVTAIAITVGYAQDLFTNHAYLGSTECVRESQTNQQIPNQSLCDDLQSRVVSAYVR